MKNLFSSRKSQVASRKSRLAVGFAASLTCFALNAQPVNQPTSSDLNTYLSTNVACSSSCHWLPYAQMGDNGKQYDFQYSNSGAFKLEIQGHPYLTWVTDFEMLKWDIPRGSIAHWETAAGGATGFTLLNAPNIESEDTWDPDVVQLEDQLYSVYYTIGQPNASNNFPGNGAGLLDYRVRFEIFTATDVPVSLSNTEIQKNNYYDVHYLKNPNIDVSVIGDIAMVWEEKGMSENNNHIYAKGYDNTNGLSSSYFDLDPLNFEYAYFYNPDVAMTNFENAQIPAGDNPVYITFMGVTDFGAAPKLLVYETTIDDIKNGTGDANTSQLHVVATLNNHNDVAVGDPFRDYLYRPRIAARPQPDGFFIGTGGRQFSIVVPNLKVGSPDFSSNIEQYTLNGTFASGFFNQTLTQGPSPSIASIDCALNFEPAIDVNEEGYDVIWNHDMQGNIANNSPYAPTDNPFCSVANFPYEQTILRKRCNTTGAVSYQAYSKVPESGVSAEVYSPSVAYDRFQAAGITSGTHADKTFYAWHKGLAYSQESNYRLSTFSSAYLKKAENDAISFDNTVLKETSTNVYEINTNYTLLKVQVLDLNGRIVPIHASISGSSNSVASIDLNNISKGLYVVQLQSQNSTSSLKVLVK